MIDSSATWRELLQYTLEDNGESFEDIVANTMSEEEMDIVFDSGWGSAKGIPFTVWTTNYVYFPIAYDGAEWVGSISRNPNGEAAHHQGGE